MQSAAGRLEGDCPLHRPRRDVFLNVGPSPTHPFGNCLTHSNTSWSPNQGDNIQAIGSTFFISFNGSLKSYPASFRTVVLTLEHMSESPGGPIKTHIARPHPGGSDPVGLRWAQEFAFLAGSSR